MKKQRSGVVSVILVNFRGTDDTLECVRGLQSLNWPADKLEIIIVENGSGDDSLARLGVLGDTVTLIESTANLGFTGGCNLGVTSATGEFIAFLNNDARPHPDWISSAIHTFGTGKDIGAVASKVLDWEGDRVDFVDAAITWYGMGYKPHAGEHDLGAWDDEKDVLFGTGAAMFVRAEVFELLGGFDDSYFMFYEDVDLGWRMNLLGYRVRYQPASLAYHRHHASMEKFGNFHELYLLERNALFTLYKNIGAESFDRSVASSLLLAVRRAVGRAGLDSGSLDLRVSGSDKEPLASVSKEALAGLYAIDQLVEALPGLQAQRDKIQATRMITDRQIRVLLGNTDEPAYPIDTYLEGYEKIVTALGVLDEEPRRRILVITGDPIGEKMAGPAIRAFNIAKLLAIEHEVRLISSTRASISSPDFEIAQVSHHRPSSIDEHEKWADVIVVQGHGIALFPSIANTGKILVVDIYDPLHLEQLEQGRHQTMDLWDAQVADATDDLNRQLTLGDFFLCASDRQRSFWLGQLAAVGRVNPYTYAQNNDLDQLIAIAPFGIPAEAPVRTRAALRGVVPGIGADDKIVIWGGGIYNWFDPESLIEAIGELSQRHPDLRLFFMGTQHPNPNVPEMAASVRSRELSDRLGLTGTVVFFNDTWVDFDDRQNYLLDADLGVSTHFQHVETTFSFRTRILDYLWAGLPIVSTAGDSFGDLVAAEKLGAAVPQSDVAALVTAIEVLLYDPAVAAAARTAVARVREQFYWERAMAPLVEFCRAPVRAADRAPAKASAKASNKIAARMSLRTPRVAPKSGIARDIQRVQYYLQNGGVRSVVERFQARRRRFRDSR
ncbi:MAG: glycosyltransferase [Microbacteriaceae bacterium]|nr:glycosyltransferase [Microbacteriaceae bacterium]